MPTINGVRWYNEASDLARVLELAAAADPADPLPEEELRAMRADKEVILKCYVVGNRVVGYVAYAARSKSIEIVRLAVDPLVQRRGVGTALAAAPAATASHLDQRFIAVTVRETNDAAVGLLRSLGYRATAVLRGHYPGTGEDGYRFNLRIKESIGAASPGGNS